MDIMITFEHHGVKGMHWGVRRYQNYDGSPIARINTKYDNKRNKIDNWYEKTSDRHARRDSKRLEKGVADSVVETKANNTYNKLSDKYHNKLDKNENKRKRNLLLYEHNNKISNDFRKNGNDMNALSYGANKMLQLSMNRMDRKRFLNTLNKPSKGPKRRITRNTISYIGNSTLTSVSNVALIAGANAIAGPIGAITVDGVLTGRRVYNMVRNK